MSNDKTTRKKYQHKQLAAGKWYVFSLVEQLANVGSEISRTINWKQKNDDAYAERAFYRALELLELTIKDPKNKDRLKEICRTREALIDWHLGNRLYNTSDEQWRRYFLQFGLAARRNR